jgi:hypothetical protein
MPQMIVLLWFFRELSHKAFRKVSGSDSFGIEIQGDGMEFIGPVGINVISAGSMDEIEAFREESVDIAGINQFMDEFHLVICRLRG